MPADDYHRAVDLPGISAHTLPRGRALNAGEIRALFVACATDRSPAGARDAAMLALLYGAGMRRQEVVRLDVEDFEVETGAVTIRAGKGAEGPHRVHLERSSILGNTGSAVRQPLSRVSTLTSTSVVRRAISVFPRETPPVPPRSQGHR